MVDKISILLERELLNALEQLIKIPDLRLKITRDDTAQLLQEIAAKLKQCRENLMQILGSTLVPEFDPSFYQRMVEVTETLTAIRKIDELRDLLQSTGVTKQINFLSSLFKEVLSRNSSASEKDAAKKQLVETIPSLDGLKELGQRLNLANKEFDSTNEIFAKIKSKYQQKVLAFNPSAPPPPQIVNEVVANQGKAVLKMGILGAVTTLIEDYALALNQLAVNQK